MGNGNKCCLADQDISNSRMYRNIGKLGKQVEEQLDTVLPTVDFSSGPET